MLGLFSGQTKITFSFFIYSLLAVSQARAGSVTGNVGSTFQDPCSLPADANAPQCTPDLANRYLQRCMTHFVGNMPLRKDAINSSWTSLNQVSWIPQHCSSGRCEGWVISSLSRFLVVANGSSPYFYERNSCSTTYLRRLGMEKKKTRDKEDICVLNNKFSRRNGWNNPVAIEKIYTKPSNIENLPNNSRVSVRAIMPAASSTNWQSVGESDYAYSLTLQDALCTWHKFCDPSTRSVRSGVSLEGEAVPNSYSKFFPSDHPIVRLCKMEPKWFLSSHALSCTLEQKGGLDELCKTPNPLDVKSVLGVP